MSKKEAYILFLVKIAGYHRGQMIPYQTAPYGAKLWCDGGEIQMDKKICQLVDQERNPITHEEIEKNNDLLEHQTEIESKFDRDGFEIVEATAENGFVVSDNNASVENDTVESDNNDENKSKQRCNGRKSNGARCQRTAPKGSKYCLAHMYQQKS